MRIKVNGQWQDTGDGLSVAWLLESLSLEPRRVAVELNKQIVRRATYAETSLADNDEIEIVTLVGGG